MSKLTERFIVGCTIIDEPGTYKVKVMSNVNHETVGSDNKRYLVNLRACTSEDMDKLVGVLYTEGEVPFKEIDSRFYVGAVWPDQIERKSDLPVKGEDVIIVVDYVDDKLMCTRLDLVLRTEYEVLNVNAIKQQRGMSKLFL